jgi:hypothetical protein
MTSKLGLNTETPIMLLLVIFYLAAGIAQIGYFAIESAAAPLHIPLLGILSLLTAYSLLKLRKWSMILVSAIFATGLTFAATTLNASIAVQTFGGAILFHLALIVYMILLAVAFIYLLLKRNEFN